MLALVCPVLSRLVPLFTNLHKVTPMSQTISEAIKQDHREIFGYYDEYLRAKEQGDTDAQARWARQLTWEVARHSAGEELVVYPLFEKYMGDEGKNMADEDRADHQKVKELLYHFESLSAGSPEYDDTLARVVAELRTHISAEESQDLPALESHLSPEESREVATSFSRTKMLVPTRAHPSAPDKPPFETLAGLMAAPMDKLKDALSKFPTAEMRQEAATHGN